MFWVEVGEEVLIGIIEYFVGEVFCLGGCSELLEGVDALVCIF